MQVLFKGYQLTITSSPRADEIGDSFTTVQSVLQAGMKLATRNTQGVLGKMTIKEIVITNGVTSISVIDSKRIYGVTLAQ